MPLFQIFVTDLDKYLWDHVAESTASHNFLLLFPQVICLSLSEDDCLRAL